MQQLSSLSRRQFVALGAGLAAGAATGGAGANELPLLKKADVCVYGATASGLMAAVAASREGCAVIVVEPSRWLGGMTGGGISRVDWGREEAVGGTARAILGYQPGIRASYDNAQYRDTFQALVAEHGIEVVFEHRLHHVRLDGARIAQITLEYAPPDELGCPPPKPIERESVVVQAAVFIDCSNEGDLVAASGVDYTYGREARRMVSDYVIAQKDLEGRADPGRSIGLGSYGVDDWPYATIAIDGKVALSGGEFSILYLDEKHKAIYKVPYEAITPRRGQCENLLVPVCCSASHIAMNSLRMEPVWMILGESAGVAAAMAARENMSVHDVVYSILREKLLALGQRLECPA